MKLTLIGGGGFRVPQLFSAIGGGGLGRGPVGGDPAGAGAAGGAAGAAPRAGLSADSAGPTVTELCLHDVDASRLDTMRAILSHLAPTLPHPPRVTVTTDLDEAITGAGFIFSAMRVGGIDGRIADERVALDLGVLGQETVGPGGLAYAMRTLPVASRLASRVRELAPDAWVINFTNPAGLVTEAMREFLGDRVIGICDTPIGLMRRATRVAGRGVGLTSLDQASLERVSFDYVGLNHLGWLRRLSIDGVDHLPALLASDSALESIEEARLMGFDWIRAIGALPNEYLFYYYFEREATARIRTSETRGEFLKGQQERFYARALGASPADAHLVWQETLREREFTYMAESRSEEEREGREEADVEDGGYQQVALDLMSALTGGPAATMILNVANRSGAAGPGQPAPRAAVPELPDHAVIEIACRVSEDGVRPLPIAPVAGDMLGLMQRVKAAEQLTLSAVRHRDPALAWRAFATHPLVDSVTVAKSLLEGYRARIPGVAAAFE
ncbi:MULTISPECIES: 6-phospho-beta-glucosidase [unclassified Leucobacter]|uniref:family 4 glycosyl hydrolase n=1 Tax=unclassified Leucobacter TaxID=2621730 RepID=UPI00165DE19A|nr:MULTISPECIES: 6-phospho-beta-glucosidase [unclassified Leucobacter]MBC9936030.1 6-phospho-beta-glucosidase [Leucobacter sp. cx-87]